jgi:hypothetical protein
VLKVKELEKLSASLKLPEFRKQLGPFTLIQRPPTPAQRPVQADEVTNPWGPEGGESTSIARPEAVTSGTLALLFQFDTLVVATLPPLQGVDELLVGRQPDCELVINDASVSKRHATLRWDVEKSRATVQDLGSRNGTYINAGSKVDGERTLKDGDIVSFGEVQFWYLLTETLYAKLAQGKSAKLHRGV